MKPTIKQAPASRKELNIRWAILKRVKQALGGGGDNFKWVGFVRKARKA